MNGKFKKMFGKKFAKVLSVFLSCAIAVSSFAPVVYADDAPVTEPAHRISHKIFMGSGNVCNFPEVGTTAKVAKGQVFAVRFYDKGELIDVEKITFSNDVFEAAGFENTNTCGGDDHIDFRATDAAELGEATLNFTINFDDGEVHSPSVTVNVVEGIDFGWNWDFQQGANPFVIPDEGSETITFWTSELPTGYTATAKLGWVDTSDANNHRFVAYQNQVGISQTDNGDGTYTVTFDGSAIKKAYSDYSERGCFHTAVVIEDSNGGDVRTQGFDGFWESTAPNQGNTGGGEEGEDLAPFQGEIEYAILGANGGVVWQEYDPETQLELASQSMFAVRFKPAGGHDSYVAMSDIEVIFHDDYVSAGSYNDQDAGRSYDLISMNDCPVGEDYVIQFNIHGQQTAYVNVAVTRGHYYGETMPSKESDFNGTIDLEFPVEGEHGEGYYNASRGETIKARFFDLDENQLSIEDVGYSKNDDFSIRYNNENNYLEIEVEEDARYGFHTVVLSKENYGSMTLVFRISPMEAPQEEYFHGETMPTVEAFNGKVGIILGSENEYTGPYHGTCQGSSTGIKFYYANGTAVTFENAGVIGGSDDFDIVEVNDTTYGNYYNLTAKADAKVGYHTVKFHIDNVGDYTMVLYVSTPMPMPTPGGSTGGATSDRYHGDTAPNFSHSFLGYPVINDSSSAGMYEIAQGGQFELKYFTLEDELVPASTISLAEYSSDFMVRNDGDRFTVMASPRAQIGYHSVFFVFSDGSTHTFVIKVNPSEDESGEFLPLFDGVIQWLDVTNIENGTTVEEWNTIPNCGTITIDINARFAVRFMDNNGELVYDSNCGYDNIGLDTSNYYMDEERGYLTYDMAGLPAGDTNFHFELMNDTRVEFKVQTVDNSGIEMMVWDDFAEEYKPITALNLMQGYQDEIAFFDGDGNQISGENIKDIEFYVLIGEPEIFPCTQIDGDTVVVYAYDEDVWADVATYRWEMTVNGVRKSIILSIGPNFVGGDSEFFSPEFPETPQHTDIEIYALVGDSNEPEQVNITGTSVDLTQGEMFGVEFYDNGEKVDLGNVGYVDGSPALCVNTDSETTAYGGMDIIIDSNAAPGYHWAVFKVNNKEVAVIVCVTEGHNEGPEGPQRPDYEDTFEGTVQIAMDVTAAGGIVPDDYNWEMWTYDEHFANGIDSHSDHIYAIRFVDEYGKVITNDRIDIVEDGGTKKFDLPEDCDYNTFNLGDSYYTGDYYLTFCIDGMYYKTIKVVSKYAVVTDWMAKEENRPITTDIILTELVNPTDLSQMISTLNFEFTEEHGDIYLHLNGNINAFAAAGKPFIKTTGNLEIMGSGNLTVHYNSNEETAAFDIGGSLGISPETYDVTGRNRRIEIDNQGTASVNIVAGNGFGGIYFTDLTVDGDIVITDNSNEEYCDYWIEDSEINAKDIGFERSVSVMRSVVNAETLSSDEDIHIYEDSSVNIAAADEDTQVGIHAGRYINIMDSTVNVEGNPVYHENLGFCALIYAGDEIYIDESEPEEQEGEEEPVYVPETVVNVVTDAEQIYGIAARNVSMQKGKLFVTMDGENSTAVFTYGNAHDYDYGFVAFSGVVGIESEGNGILSYRDIQFGDGESRECLAEIVAENGYALAVDTEVESGRIVLENTGIALYGSKGAIQARYIPTSTETGEYDFGYNANIVLRAGQDMENLVRAYTYEDILGVPFVITDEPSESDLVTVNFVSNGAAYEMKPMTKVSGNIYGALPVPFKKGYRFDGWVKYNLAGEEEYQSEGTTVPLTDVTLYAKWIEADANTYYFDGIDTRHYVLPYYYGSFVTDHTNQTTSVKNPVVNFVFEGSNYIEWYGSHVFSLYGYKTTYNFKSEDWAMIEIHAKGSGGTISSGDTNKVVFSNKGWTLFDGTIYASDITFNAGEYELYSDYFWALQVSDSYNAAGKLTINNGAIVSAGSGGEAAIRLYGSTLTVNKGGAIGAQGADYGVTSGSGMYNHSTKITVAEKGTLLAQGNKAALKADSYSFNSQNLMVAGFDETTAKKVKSYNNQRFFATGTSEYVQVGDSVDYFNYVVVNGEYFDVDSDFNTEDYNPEYGFRYEANVEFMGEKGKNVLYLEPGFEFTQAEDLGGIYAYIFSTDDLVITSAAEDYTTVVYNEDDYGYSVYSLGNVRICNVELGGQRMDFYAESLFIDSMSVLEAKDFRLNGYLASMVASVHVYGTLDVKGDAILCGMNAEEHYDVYAIYGEDINGVSSTIGGTLKLDRAALYTVSDLTVGGNIELISGVLVQESIYEDDQHNIIAKGDININDYSTVEVEHLTGKNITVNGEETSVTAEHLNGTNFTLKEGDVTTTTPDGYQSLYVTSAITISGGELLSIGGMAAKKVTISGGHIVIPSGQIGIDANAVAIKGGYVDIYVAGNGIIVRGGSTSDVLTITGGTVDIISTNESAIHVVKGTKATINTSTNKKAAVVRLYGGDKAVDNLGTFTPYGTLLTAADTFDGLNNVVKKYSGERYFYVNSQTHFTATFVLLEGVKEFEQSVIIGDCVARPADPERDGYTFTGWYTEDGELYNFDTDITGDIELIAGWRANSYNVKFYTTECTHDGTHDKENVLVNSFDVVYDSAYGEFIDYENLPTPEECGYTREGHKFLGWSTVEGDAAYIVDAFTTVTTAYDHNLYAIWELVDYEVILSANGGTFVVDSKAYGEAVVVVPYYMAVTSQPMLEPIRANYRFTGWYTDAEATQEYVLDTPITDNTTVLYAGWELANTVADVTVLVNGEPVTPDNEGRIFVKLGDRIALATATESATINYTFAGVTKAYTEAVTITKQMLVDTFNGTEDVLSLTANAERTEYKPSNNLAVEIVVDAGRNDWGDITVTDRALISADINGDGIVDALDVPDYMWIGAVVNEVEYTGSAIKPEFNVYDGKTMLTSGTDYTVSYANNTKAGTATITVKGKGLFADSLTKTFTITPMEIDGSAESGAVFTTSDAIVKTYNKKAQKVDPKLNKDGKALKKDTDYTLVYQQYNEETGEWVEVSPKEVGEYRIVIKGKGNYTSKIYVPYSIIEAKLASVLKVTVENAKWTGEATAPKVTVKDGTKTLVAEVNYTLVYEQFNAELGEWAATTPVDAGEYRVRVVCDEYEGYVGEVEKAFTVGTVLKSSMLKNFASSVKFAEGTLAYVQPETMYLTSNGKTSGKLVEDTNFTAEYTENTVAGVATVTFTGMPEGGYYGSFSKTFTIGTKLTSSMIKGFASNVDYLGDDEAHIQEGMYLVNGKTTLNQLPADENEVLEDVTYHYEVLYTGNTKAGTATVIITGVPENGYYGEVVKTYTIGTKLTSSMVKDFKSELNYHIYVNDDGYVKQPNDSLKRTVKVNGKNKTIVLTEDVDYTVDYYNNTTAGTATVTYTGIGAYSGTVTKTFKVTATNISTTANKKKITLENWIGTVDYTGTEHTLSNDFAFIFDGEELEKDVDYTVSYSKNTNAGTATVTFKGIGVYSGSYSKTFTINKVNAATSGEVDVTFESSMNYTKGGAKMLPTVMFNGEELVNGTDYTVSYKDKTYTAANKTATATVKFKGNFTGSVTDTYFVDYADLADATITAADKTYSNKKDAYKVTPKLVDTNGKALESGSKKDFVVAGYNYAEDIELANGVVRHAGEQVAKNDIVPAGAVIEVIVTGANNYKGTENSVTYRVTAGSVSSATFSIEAQNYTGSEVELDKNQITVKVGGKELADSDYEIIGYSNNVKVGTAKVTIQGVGNYGGTKTATFKIQAKSAQTTIKFMANGGTGTLSSQVVKDSDIELRNNNKIKRTGYTFAGWNTEKDGSGVQYDNMGTFYAADRGDARTVRLYAQWEATHYTISYNLNAVDAVFAPEVTSYTIENATFNLTSPEREGYKFAGWYTDAKCTKGKTTQIKKGSTGNKTFYAKWTKIK